MFWSTSFFPGQSNTTLGAWIDKAHPAFSQFPTDNYTDWQWKEITQGRSFIINEHPQLHPIVQPVSDFHINDKLASIFECKVSKGKLLVCGYNLNLDSPVARQLKYSLLHYMTQSNFNPSYSIEIDTLKKMFAYTPKAMVSVPKGFENSILYISCGKQMKNSVLLLGQPRSTILKYKTNVVNTKLLVIISGKMKKGQPGQAKI